MENSKKSDFRFKGLKVTHSEITLKGASSNCKDLKIGFSAKGEKTKSKFTLFLETEIFDVEQTLYIKLNTEGYYEFKEDIPADKLGNFFTINAPSHIIPIYTGLYFNINVFIRNRQYIVANVEFGRFRKGIS